MILEWHLLVVGSISVSPVLLPTMLSFTFLLLKEHYTGATLCGYFCESSATLGAACHSVIRLYCSSSGRKIRVFWLLQLEKRLLCSKLISVILFIFCNILDQVTKMHKTAVYTCIDCKFTMKLLEYLIKLFCEFLPGGSTSLISDIGLVLSKRFLDIQTISESNNWKRLQPHGALTFEKIITK